MDEYVIDIAERDGIPSLQTPVQFLSGVGPARAPLLERLELKTAEDVLFNVPRDVLDLSRVTRVRDLQPDTLQTVKGKVVDRDARLTNTGKMMTAVLLDCGEVFRRSVAFVIREAVARKLLVKFPHDAVPRHFGDDARRRDGIAEAIAIDNGGLRTAKRFHGQTIDERVLRRGI